MKRITVTGGSGFIGTNLVAYLLERGYEVQNIDKNPPKNSELVSRWESADILDFDAVREKIETFRPDILVHLAAVTDLDGNNAEYYAANTRGTANIIQISKATTSVKKVIFTSSMYVCQPGYIPKDFDDYHPHTEYGKSKVQGELMVKALTDINFEWVIVRPTSIWGPWFGIPYIDFFEIVYKGRYVDFGKACTKTYGFIDNTVFQIHQLMCSSETRGKTYYLGDMPPIQISDWANEISGLMGKGRIATVPFSLLKLAALVGDLLTKFGMKFPMTSFRLNNMTTDNVLPLENLYHTVGEAPISRTNGIKKTLAWLKEYKGYTFRNDIDI